MRRGVVALLLQQILQRGIGFQALALQLQLRIEQRLLGAQHHLLTVAQRILPRRLAAELAADLLQALRGGVHGALYPLGLGLQRHQLAVVGGEALLRALQLVERLIQPAFQLAQRQRQQRSARRRIVHRLLQRIQFGSDLIELRRRLLHLLFKLRGVLPVALEGVQQLQRAG